MSFKKALIFPLLIWGAQAFATDPHHDRKAESQPDPRVYQMEDSGPDVKIPSQLWNLLHEIKPDKSLTFASLKIRLEEKTKGVLVAPVLVIELPRGGGEVDLSHFVRDVQGTFLVFFEYDEMRETKEEQIFFVSKAKRRKLQKEVWGAGCNKFMDITQFMTSKVLNEGLEVNTTRQRHLSLLGGSFVFSTKNQIAQVTFRDSTAPQLFCEELKLSRPGKSNEVSD